MKNIPRFLGGLALLASLVSIPATAHAQEVYPACFSVSTFGTGNLTPGAPAVGRGTGTVTLGAFYADSQNLYPDDVWVEYSNNSKYRAGATDADYTLTLVVNGTPIGTTPKTKSPTYLYHADFFGGYESPPGFFHPWLKGDLVTARVNVLFHPTLNSGYTEATCRL